MAIVMNLLERFVIQRICVENWQIILLLSKTLIKATPVPFTKIENEISQLFT